VSQSAGEALQKAVSETPRDVVILKYGIDNTVGISWSEMDMEKLCYLKDVFALAVQDRLKEAFRPATRHAPAPVLKTREASGRSKKNKNSAN
jgi:hypothetical protein